MGGITSILEPRPVMGGAHICALTVSQAREYSRVLINVKARGMLAFLSALTFIGECVVSATHLANVASVLKDTSLKSSIKEKEKEKRK